MTAPTPALDDVVTFTPEWALRYLDREARRCRDRDSHEALCLLLPALLKCFKLSPCDDFQALDFESLFHKELRYRIERERKNDPSNNSF